VGYYKPQLLFCYAIIVFGNTVFFPPVYLNPVFLTQYCAGGEIEKDEMGRTCGAHGGGKRGAQGVGGET
jgi:hypothetical protein